MDKKYTSSINRRSPRPRSKRLREQGIGAHVSGAAVAPSGNDFGLQDSLLNFRLGVNTLLVPCDSQGNEITWEEASQLDSDGNIKAKSLKAKVNLWSAEAIGGKGMTGVPSSGGGGGGSLFGLYTDTTWVSTPADDDALSAVLGKSLHARVSVLEGAGYLTAITKAMVENVLTGDITSHTHSLLSKPADTRSVATTPNDYNGKFFFTGMKRRDALNVPGAVDYVNGFGWRGWGDSSGGKAWEVFGDNADLYVRCGSTTTWEAWRKILTDGNYSSILDGRYIRPTGTASQFLMGDGSVTAKVTASNLTTLGWTSGAVDALRIPDMNLLAYWNGCLSGTLSNLQYCDRGRFGTMAVASAADYVTVATAQSISGVKTFTGGLHLKMGNNFANNYNDGFRIHVCGTEQWASVLLCGSDNTGDAGTSANTWGLFTHAGAFGIGRNGNGISSGAARLWCDTNNTWNISGLLKIGSLNVSSNALVSNLNADMLDGQHGNYYRENVTRFAVTKPASASNIIDANADISLGGVLRNYYGMSGWTNVPSGEAYGAILNLLPNYSGLKAMAGQLMWGVSGNAYFRMADSETTFTAWHQIAFTDSNVASATKLQTARSIWGQSFDGTAAISGELKHVTALRFDSGNALVEGAGNSWNLWSVNGFQFFPKMSATVSALSINANGRVGVNMFSPQYDFDVTGVIHASGEICSDKALSGKGMTSSSDSRQKHILGDLVMSLDDVLSIPLKRFKWLDDTDKEERIGTIAQDALKIVPQVVYLKSDGYYGVDYGALAHAEVKTVAKVVAQLVERLNKLESQLNTRA